MRLPPAKPHPKLDALLEWARNHVMTKEEIAAQRKSWVIGNMMLDHPEMTRERAEELYRKIDS